jgi:DNA-binding response OmpR family regulator
MTRYKILVADDQELMRTILVRFIQRAGYDVITAQNGEEAIDLYRLEHPALVISDIQMPKMNGLTLLKEIKKIDLKAFVILISGFGSEEVLLQALRGGAINFFKKPFKVEEVVDVLHQVLRHREIVQFPELATPTLIEDEKEFEFAPFDANVLAVINQITLNLGCLLPEAEIINVRIGIEEMINNAIEHGCLDIDFKEKNAALRSGAFNDLIKEKMKKLLERPRRIRVTSRLTADALTVVVRDDGKGFDWRSIPALSGENLLQYNGRGIFLTKIFFDSVSYNAAGNEVTLRKLKKTT